MHDKWTKLVFDSRIRDLEEDLASLRDRRDAETELREDFRRKSTASVGLSEIEWNDKERRSVCIDEYGDCENVITVSARELFAWVDRVRANGETNL